MDRIIAILRQSADSKFAFNLQRFFKTGKGEYGYGDVFLGLRMPKIRAILADEYAMIDPQIVDQLLGSKFHEARMLGVLWLVKKFEEDPSHRHDIYRQYVKNFHRINNWDLVDVSAPKITGQFLKETKSSSDGLGQILTWCESDHLWTRRIGILSTWPFIRAEQFEPIISATKLLLENEETHDLMHKAAGWMLRETGKVDKGVLEEFLKEHARNMPRVMLRYSIEKLKPPERKHFLDARRTLNVDNKQEKAVSKRGTKRKRK